MRKRVPAATTRRGRVDGGRGVGVGDGRRRDMAMVKQDGMSQSSSSSSRSGELSRPAVGATSVRSGREQADIPQLALRDSGRFSIRLSIMATVRQVGNV